MKLRALFFSLSILAIAVPMTSNRAGAQSLASFPDGDYSYVKPGNDPRAGSDRLLFRKSGSAIVGTHELGMDSFPCFRGRAGQNDILDLTWGYQIALGFPDWQFAQKPNPNFSLSGYRPRQISQRDSSAIQGCIDVFRPLVNTGINVGMYYEAVRRQLSRQQWQFIADRGWPEDSCGEAFCAGNFRKGSYEMRVLTLTGRRENRIVYTICLYNKSASRPGGHKPTCDPNLGLDLD